MHPEFQLLFAALAVAALTACSERSGDIPAKSVTPATPATTASAPSVTSSSGDHPSEPAGGQKSEPVTPAPAPGSGEGASASTDPSQKK